MKKVVMIIDNIRSAYNVGSILRTADGAGATKVYICGISAPTYHPSVQKTALGAQEIVDTEYFKNTKEAIEKVKDEGYTVVGVELANNAIDYREYKYPEKTALLMGHEVTGVSEEIQELCDDIIQMPMRGKKESLNVASSAAIVLYESMRDIT